MDKEVLYKLSNYGKNKQFSAGETIFDYGDSADEIYLILTGLVKLFIKIDNQKTKITQLTSGELLGELALLKKKTRSSQAITAENTTLLAFEPDILKKLTHKQPSLNDTVLNNLCQRIHQLQSSLAKSVDQTDHSRLNSSFYLKGHGEYSTEAKDDFGDYLYEKTISCPVCSTDIKVKKVRNSRLHRVEIRDDLRPIYKNFNPNWYKIWLCPHCFYAARKKDFFEFSSSQQRKIKNKFKDKIKSNFGKQYQPDYSEPRQLKEVFNAYYLALKLYDFIGAQQDKIADLWLRLNWLYEDAEKKQLSKTASQKAMNHLHKFYFQSHSKTKLSQAQKNKQKLLLALLLHKHEKTEQALPLLDDLIRSSQINRRYKQLARDKFMEIRDNK